MRKSAIKPTPSIGETTSAVLTTSLVAVNELLLSTESTLKTARYAIQTAETHVADLLMRARALTRIDFIQDLMNLGHTQLEAEEEYELQYGNL